jgi:hypothetical protein
MQTPKVHQLQQTYEHMIEMHGAKFVPQSDAAAGEPQIN